MSDFLEVTGYPVFHRTVKYETGRISNGHRISKTENGLLGYRTDNRIISNNFFSNNRKLGELWEVHWNHVAITREYRIFAKSAT